ncbi:hypothetical protein VNO78_11696 [Psophocarpus tetragonolobus]|uniref:Uncharacterized protein n=1 Tax=Psophocarpus tetragonolobus TaxID=3891 RepID=A0AAN9SMY2_PSOTE
MYFEYFCLLPCNVLLFQHLPIGPDCDVGRSISVRKVDEGDHGLEMDVHLKGLQLMMGKCRLFSLGTHLQTLYRPIQFIKTRVKKRQQGQIDHTIAFRNPMPHGPVEEVRQENSFNPYSVPPSMACGKELHMGLLLSRNIIQFRLLKLKRAMNWMAFMLGILQPNGCFLLEQILIFHTMVFNLDRIPTSGNDWHEVQIAQAEVNANPVGACSK